MDRNGKRRPLTKRAAILHLLSFAPAVAYIIAGISQYLDAMFGMIWALLIAAVLPIVYLLVIHRGYRRLTTRPSLVNDRKMFTWGFAAILMGCYIAVIGTTEVGQELAFSWSFALAFLLCGCLFVLCGFVIRADLRNSP